MDRFSNQVEIECSSLGSNLRRIRSILAQGTALTAVVKADAYGHGMVGVARALERAGVDRLAVAHSTEGLRLREAGVGCPIVVLCGILTRSEAEAVVEHELIPVLLEPGTAEVLDDEAQRRGKRVRVQLKIDTGMGRLGVPAERTGEFVDQVLKRRGLEPEGLVSHLSSADDSDRTFTEDQIRRFQTALEAARERGMDTRASSLANSAGTLEYPEAHLEMVRPGIILYGGSPSPDLRPRIALKPVMTMRGRVLQVRDLPKAFPVGYAGTYTTARAEKIAVLSVGYSDGLPRSLSNRGQVLIRGRRAPIRGRICMDLTLADVTGLPGVQPGDEAVLLGRQGDEVLTGDEVARAAGTVSYEIYCAMGRSREKTIIP